MWGDELPSVRIQHSTLLRFIPQDIRERIGDGPQGINGEKDLEMNLDIIERYMLKAYPQNKCRLNLYNLIEHSSDIKFPDMI